MLRTKEASALEGLSIQVEDVDRQPFNHLRPKKKLFVSCNPYPNKTSFYSKKPYPKVFSALPTPNQRKTCIKHTFLTKKIMQKKYFLLTFLPDFFSNRYRKQTISFFRPKVPSSPDAQTVATPLGLKGEVAETGIYKSGGGR